MRDAMLDLETWGNSNHAVIVQIGACYFDRNTGEIGDKFFCNVDADSGIRAGFEVSASTMYWWLQQSEAARASLQTLPIETVQDAVAKVNQFLKRADCIWSHATFDYVILMNHLHKLNIKPKFHYRSARDLRTLVDLTEIEHREYTRIGTEHNALDDCLYQVQYAVDCMRVLKH